MSLVACKECGKQISDDADACPHCGKKVERPSGCFLTILIGLGIIVIGSIANSCNPKPPEDYRATPDEALAACRTAIKLVLNDPESAQWEVGGYVKEHPDGSWTAQRTFRAKNAFGAYRLAVYECHIAPNGDGTWRGLSIKQLQP